MKFVALLCAACLGLTLIFTGCGGQESSESQASQPESSQASGNSLDSEYSSLVSSLLEEEGEVEDLLLVSLPEGGETHVYSGSSLLKGESFQLDRDLNGDGISELFRVSRESPSGLRVLASYEQRGQNLAAYLTLEEAFDQAGDLKEDWYVQLSLWDLDDNGQPDILLSAGDGKERMETAVVLFDSSSSQHFVYLGSVTGTSRMTVSGGKLTDADGTEYEVKDRKLYG